jgi:hypothetical protein
VISEAVTRTTVVEVIGLGLYDTHAAELVCVTKMVDCDKLTVAVSVAGWTKLEHAELITLQTKLSNWGGSFEIAHELGDVDICGDVVDEEVLDFEKDVGLLDVLDLVEDGLLEEVFKVRGLADQLFDVSLLTGGLEDLVIVTELFVMEGALVEGFSLYVGLLSLLEVTFLRLSLNSCFRFLSFSACLRFLSSFLCLCSLWCLSSHLFATASV